MHDEHLIAYLDAKCLKNNTIPMLLQYPTPENVCKGHLCSFWLDENGVFHIKVSDRLITTSELEDDYRLILDYLNRLNFKPPVLYDASDLTPIDKKIRERLDELLQEVFSSLAVISSSKIGLTIARIFFALTRSEVPRKIFSNYKDALEWSKMQRVTLERA